MVLLNLLRDLIHSNCKKSKNKSIPTKSYKDGKYRISNHAITRMNDRKITKGELHVNLHTTPIKLSPIKYGDMALLMSVLVKIKLIQELILKQIKFLL